MGYYSYGTSILPPTNVGEACAEEPTIEQPLPEKLAMDEPAAEMEEPTDETAMAGLENTAEGLRNESAPIDENLSGQRGTVEFMADKLADCRGPYFDVRMYGVADYFMIDDLERKAAETFMTHSILVSKRGIPSKESPLQK